jgi:hypothetical protein
MRLDSTENTDYNLAGEVLTDTQTVPGLAPAVVLSDGYTNGNRTSLSANLGGTVNQATSAVTGGTPDFLNNYSYTASATNPYGQMSEVSQTGNGGNAVAAKTATFQYDLQAELTGVGRYQSANATANLVAQATYGRDNDGNLTSLVYANGGSTLPVYAWTYDSLGDMATASETLGSIVNAVSYTSDSTGQLLTATGGPAAETFAYDTNGNRQTATARRPAARARPPTPPDRTTRFFATGRTPTPSMPRATASRKRTLPPARRFSIPGTIATGW